MAPTCGPSSPSLRVCIPAPPVGPPSTVAPRRPGAPRPCDAPRVSDPVLPALPPGAVAILATVGPAGPVAIPVSAVLRAGPRDLLLGLAGRRGSLVRLR